MVAVDEDCDACRDRRAQACASNWIISQVRKNDFQIWIFVLCFYCRMARAERVSSWAFSDYRSMDDEGVPWAELTWLGEHQCRLPIMEEAAESENNEEEALETCRDDGSMEDEELTWSLENTNADSLLRKKLQSPRIWKITSQVKII